MRLLNLEESSRVTGAANFSSVQDCCWVGLALGVGAGIPAMCAATLGPIGMIGAGIAGGYLSSRMVGSTHTGLGLAAGAAAGYMGSGVLAHAAPSDALGGAILCGSIVGSVATTVIYGSIYG